MSVDENARVIGTRAAGATHRGLRRKLNEDFLLVRQELGLYVVADGVGGQNAGEVASSLAGHSIVNFFEATEHGGSWPDELHALLDLALPPAAQRLCAAIRKANLDVRSIATTHRAHREMKSTVVAAHVEDDTRATIHVAHVGDSRCYRIRGGAIELLTRDHTLRNVARYEHPDIGDDLISQIPENLLSRALGQSDKVEIDIATHDLLSGDAYLLCTDGITRMLDDAKLLETIERELEPKRACSLLIDRANEAGGRDNITALLIRGE